MVVGPGDDHRAGSAVYDGLLDGAGAVAAPDCSPTSPPRASATGPVYDRPLARPADQDALRRRRPRPRRCPSGSPAGARPRARAARRCWRCPPSADSSWVWRQYDHQLFLNTVAGPGQRRRRPAAQGRPARGPGRCPPTGRPGSASSTPVPAAALAVLEARPQRRLHRRPAAWPLVNCLNFGNPEHPEVMWQFSEVVDGMSEACRALGVPVIGGNVSFYNESDGADIHPTPVVGVVGLIDRLDVPAAAGARWPPGTRIVAPGRHRAPSSAAPSGRPAATGSWAARRPPPTWRPAPALHGLVAGPGRRAGSWPASTTAPTAGWPSRWPRWRSAETAASRVEATGSRRPGPSAACFSESANRVVLAVDEARVDEILGRAAAAGVPAAAIGTAGGDRLVWAGAFDVALADAETAWRDALPAALAGGVAPVA